MFSTRGASELAREELLVCAQTCAAALLGLWGEARWPYPQLGDWAERLADGALARAGCGLDGGLDRAAFVRALSANARLSDSVCSSEQLLNCAG